VTVSEIQGRRKDRGQRVLAVGLGVKGAFILFFIFYQIFHNSFNHT
jgi:hypothetical protein